VSRLRINAAAEEELRAAVAWYEERLPGLGAEFFSEIGRTLGLIQQHPLMGSPVPRVRAERGTRRVPLRRFPYYVIYREQDAELQVIAFAHFRRKPGYWRHRS